MDDDAGAESRAGFVAELCEGAPVAGVERGAGLDFDRGDGAGATTVVSVLFPTWRASMTNTTRVSFVKPIDQPLPAFAPRLFSHARID